MFNKKFLFLCLVIVACSFLVVGCGTTNNNPPASSPTPTPVASPTPTATPDYTIEYTVADSWPSAPGENYWGPYGDAFSITAEAGALVFDCSVHNGYCTLDFKDKPTPADQYKYAIVVLKTDNAADAVNATMTFGNIGKKLSDWGITDLSDSYQTYVLDLGANGVNSWSGLNFAMNQSEATVAKISVDKIAFAN